MAKHEYVTVFTDASYCNETGCYGWAAWIKYGNPARTIRLTGSGCKTARVQGNHTVPIRNSTEAEKLALDTAVRALRHYNVPLDGAIVTLQSDSTTALNMVKVRPINKAVRQVVRRHVKGHRGHRDARSSVNTWCDRAARRKMRERRKQMREQGNDTAQTPTG